MTVDRRPPTFRSQVHKQRKLPGALSPVLSDTPTHGVAAVIIAHTSYAGTRVETPGLDNLLCSNRERHSIWKSQSWNKYRVPNKKTAHFIEVILPGDPRVIRGDERVFLRSIYSNAYGRLYI